MSKKVNIFDEKYILDGIIHKVNTLEIPYFDPVKWYPQLLYFILIKIIEHTIIDT